MTTWQKFKCNAFVPLFLAAVVISVGMAEFMWQRNEAKKELKAANVNIVQLQNDKTDLQTENEKLKARNEATLKLFKAKQQARDITLALNRRFDLATGKWVPSQLEQDLEKLDAIETLVVPHLVTVGLFEPSAKLFGAWFGHLSKALVPDLKELKFEFKPFEFKPELKPLEPNNPPQK